jgi:pyruvate formate lyase activating enzyme
MKEALFWKKQKDGVKCVLCPRFCVLKKDGDWGICRARKRSKGKLYSMVYGKVVSDNIDPIEKKPFFHFAPGAMSLSIATTGCNLRCLFCHNADVSMSPEPFGRDISPEEIVEWAVENEVPGIAYTYTEPTVYYEFALDTMKLAKKQGLFNVWVSNGYTNPQPIKRAARYLDAINVDLKGDMKFYSKLCAVPDEAPMHTALKEYKKHDVWIEITNLMIPGYNDSPSQVQELVGWVKKNLGTSTPIHFTRFAPLHKMRDTPPTPVKSLERAHDIASKMGMKWVYIGNVPGHKFESTYCPKCGTLLVRRIGYELGTYRDKCKCGGKLKIAGKKWSGVIKVAKL